MAAFLRKWLISVLFVAALVHSLNLPGVAPNHWDEAESITLKANKVTSMKTPLQYDYYDLPFCKRRKTRAKAENLGDRLAGDTLTASPYEVSGYFATQLILFPSLTHTPPYPPPPHS